MAFGFNPTKSKGDFRLWFVCSVIWIIGCGYWQYVENAPVHWKANDWTDRSDCENLYSRSPKLPSATSPDALAAARQKYLDDCGARLLHSRATRQNKYDQLYSDEMIKSAVPVFGPPLLIFVFLWGTGLAVRWIIRGYKSQP